MSSKRKRFIKKYTFYYLNDYFLDICTLEKDSGTCDQYKIMWYYDSMSGQCKNFYYGSCGGNANRFGTEQECQIRCLIKAGLLNIFKKIIEENVFVLQEIQLVLNKLIKVMFVMIQKLIKIKQQIQ